jgi:hypothetical protein
VTDRQLFFWWFRWGLILLTLLAAPWILAAGGAYYSFHWARLVVTAPDAPRLLPAVDSGVAGLPRRLGLMIKDPEPAASAERPEKVFVTHRQQKDTARCRAVGFWSAALVSWFLCTAALFGWLAVGWRRFRRLPPETV